MTAAPSERSGIGEWMGVAEVLVAIGDGHGRPLPRSTWQRWRAEGKTPRAHRLPSGHLRIRRSEFNAWMSRLHEDKE